MSMENTKMRKRLAKSTAILGAAIALLAVSPISSASAAPAPWWKIVTGSRPTNMWEPEDNVQEVKTAKAEVFGEEVLVAEVEVEGNAVGCMAAGALFGQPGSALCGAFYPGLTPIESAADLQAALEAPYGAGKVQVSGGPAGGEPFIVTVSGKSVPPVGVSPFEFGPPFPPFGSASTKVLATGGSGRLVATFTNLGDAPVDATKTPLTIVDELPEGMEATGVEAFIGSSSDLLDCKVEASDRASCTFEDQLPPFESIEVEVLVNLLGEPPVAGAPGKVTVSGANGPSASEVQEVKVSPEDTPFGIEYLSSQIEEEGGGPATQAGGHPFQLTTALQLNAGRFFPAPFRESYVEQPAQPRNLRFPLPAGFVGNATVVPKCSMTEFFAAPFVNGHSLSQFNQCSAASAIGATSSLLGVKKAVLARVSAPVFNLTPAEGEPARFGFKLVGAAIVINTKVDPDDKYRVIASVNNTTQLPAVLSSTLTLWGAPGDPRHDNARGWGCIAPGPDIPCERPPSLSEAAFLRDPVSCATPVDFEAEVEPWNTPLGGVIDRKTFDVPDMNGCNQVPFDPSISAAPTSKLASNPSGLDFRLDMPGNGLLDPGAIAEGQAKKASVTLPEGMTLNPSQAEGLATCSPSDYANERFNSLPGEGCPEASKVGEVSFSTPLLKEEGHGSLYVASPYDNPFDSLVALYLVAKIPDRGVLVKQAGVVKPDPVTGQLITTFDDLPQLPFDTFKLHFREGGRSPLITPPGCGSFETVARFVPWSAKDPDNPQPDEIVTRTSTFTIERGVDGGACPSGAPAFNPGFTAGTLNNDAGSYSPFYMRIVRGDGEQDLSRFSSILPPGVLGKLAGIPYCPEAGIARALSRTGEHGGTLEKSDPSCPEASKIGRTAAGAGVGNQLTYVNGELYLAGPYKGAPLSVVAITPAVAGPFDAGTVVVREGLDLNPTTAEVSVDGSASDPIPHILQGIPLNLRDLRIYVDRDAFTLNATSCERSSARATLWGAGTALLPTLETPVNLASRYQAANCASLGFRPDLKLALKGGAKRGDHPAFRATYTPRKGDANLSDLVLRLPRSAFLEQAHIRTICTRVQFAADNCPKGAQYGFIKAWTPLLDQPLEGPVYLRSSSHKLPDVVFDLKGIVDVEVATRIDSVRGGIRAQVLDAPDAPISKVLLRMQGAKKGLIVNSRNLCGSTNRAGASFTGQNGKQASANPALQPQCGAKPRRGGRGRAG
jgi:hypothetical protein